MDALLYFKWNYNTNTISFVFFVTLRKSSNLFIITQKYKIKTSKYCSECYIYLSDIQPNTYRTFSSKILLIISHITSSLVCTYNTRNDSVQYDIINMKFREVVVVVVVVVVVEVVVIVAVVVVEEVGVIVVVVVVVDLVEVELMYLQYKEWFCPVWYHLVNVYQSSTWCPEHPVVRHRTKRKKNKIINVKANMRQQ